jgi:hypothetical protein
LSKGFGRWEAAIRGMFEVCDWWTQGAKKVMLGRMGERSSGWPDRRFSAKMVPALWETIETYGIERWESRAGTVSRKVDILWSRGTGVEAPKPGLLMC